MLNMCILGVPGAEDGNWGHVGVLGARHRGPGPSPWIQAVYAD
jgi:hypothetical protein